MMKKWMIAALLLSNMLTYAQAAKQDDYFNSEKCEEILAAGMFNQILEDVCGFDGGVKDALLNIYQQAECPLIVPQQRVEQVSALVLEDSRMRYKAFGETRFCADNMKAYVDLVE